MVGKSRTSPQKPTTALSAAQLKAALRRLSDPERIEASKRFFKTAKGESAAGDEFLGVKVPEQRKVAKEFRGLPLAEIFRLLKSRVHEDRSTAVFVLVDAYQHAKKDPKVRQAIVEGYLENLELTRGWDIVDSSAPKILGDWLLTRDRGVLFELIASKNLWCRRAAMVATQELIRHGQADEAYELAEMSISDPEDLMHKAAGWMLKEAGEKVSEDSLRAFLKKHASRMPRVMLRAAIEKLPKDERDRFLERAKR